MLRSLIRIVAMVGLLIPASDAQSTFSTLLGTVRDPSSAPVPGVRVRVVETSSNATRETATDQNGYWEVTNLNPGRFEITAERTGFQRFIRREIVVETAARLRVDVNLAIGETTSEITVTAGVAPVETETGRISTIQGQIQYQHLPGPANRIVFNHFILTPGAQLGNGSTFTINGSRGWSNGYTIDGTNTASPMNGAQTSAQRPHFDVVQETRTDSVGNNAEFGHSGTFTITTKPGTNELHGAADFQHSNSGFSARNPFAATKPPGRAHYYASHIAGPLLLPKIYNGRNRTFFLFSYDGYTTPGARILVPNVPTVRFRQGDFSRLFDARGVLTPVRDPLNSQPFAGNVIPAARLNATAQAFQRLFYPVPNFGGPDDLSGNFRTAYPINDGKESSFNVRLDHQITANNRAFFRYFHNRVEIKRNASDLPEIAGFHNKRFNKSWTFADTHTVTPTLVNEFRLGGMSWFTPTESELRGKAVVDQVGLTGYPGPLPGDLGGVPAVAITGFTGISTQNTAGERMLNLDLHDNISLVRGRHTAKFGFNGSHSRQNNYPASPSGVFGNFSFTGFASNYAYADFLLGLARTSGRSDAIPPTNSRNYEFAWFAQDDWKVTPNLTLNYGIRYEYHMPIRERDNRLANFDPATGALVIPGESTRVHISPLYPSNIQIATADQAGFPAPALMNADANSVSPRFGLAYRLPGAKRTALRGAFGVYYNNENRKVYSSMVSGPFVGSETYDNMIVNGRPLYEWPRAFPAAAARPLGVQNISGANPNLRDSYTQQWNLSIDRELWWQTGLRVSVVGALARQLPYRANRNQPPSSNIPFNANRRPYPQFNTITWADHGATQAYHAFQVEANRRFSGGLLFNAHYTLAKNLTDSLDTNPLGSVIENAYNRRSDRGNETYTPRQRAVVNFVYELPFGKGKPLAGGGPGWWNAVVGGWTVSGIFFARTGFWFTPSFAGSDPSNTGVVGGRPNRIADGNLPGGQRTITRWFDASAFTVPAPNSGFGNAGVGILEGPGVGSLGAALFKNFALTERLTLRINANFRNVLNTPTFYNNPASVITAPGQVAQVTAFAGALEDFPYRQGYIGVRLQW